jgi:hypothetical protein
MVKTAKEEQPSKLDNLTLAWKEGWLAFVTAPKRARPHSLTRKALKALSVEARTAYDKSRRDWHANLGPIRTPSFASVQEDLWDIGDSNQQDGDKAKGAVALDAYPGLGKTTAVNDFAKKFHLREVEENGERTQEGNERWPVCRIGLRGATGTKSLYKAMLSFYGHPGISSGNTDDFAERVLRCALDCETKILIVDEIHFLRWGNRAGVEVSNSLKHIANDFPITLIYVGVGLEARGLFSEGETYSDAVLAQTARRTTRLGMEPFEIRTEQGRRDWRNMLLALETRTVLTDKQPGMLADELSDYLFVRSTGHIGSLMTLINRGCQRAVRSGAEVLTRELMDHVKNDEASEKARKELEAAFSGHHLTTKVTRPSKRTLHR